MIQVILTDIEGHTGALRNVQWTFRPVCAATGMSRPGRSARDGVEAVR